MPQLTDVASDQQIASPHIAVTVDRDRASRLGLSLALIDQTLYDAFGQEQVTTIYTDTSQYKVILEVGAAVPGRSRGARPYLRRRPGGRPGAASAVAHFSTKVEPLTVNHQGLFPAVTLSFNLAPRRRDRPGGRRRSRQMEAQLRMPPTVRGAFQGTAQAFQSSLASTPLLVAGGDRGGLYRARHAV